MDRKQNIILLAVNRFFYTFLPFIILLYIFYEIIFNKGIEEISWIKLVTFLLFQSLLIAKYFKYSSKQEKVQDIGQLKSSISKGRWELLEDKDNELLLRPKFDYPYSILNKERLIIQYKEGTATIKGTEYYVEQLSKDISGKSNKMTRRIIGIATFLIIVLAIFSESGKDWDLRIRIHNYRMRNSQTININDKSVNGNIVGNTNNYGYAVESDEYIYYIERLNIIRADKTFQNKDVLISKSQGSGFTRLNIIEDWVFYTSGKSLKRMSFDGTESKTIYSMSYLLDINTIGEWLFFINFLDNDNIYKIDVNGQNLQRFIDIEATDIATYDEKLIYSYKDGDIIYVESVDFDGNNREVEFETYGEVRDLSKVNGDYYYIDKDSILVKNEGGNFESTQILINQEISSYIIIDDQIYYSLRKSDKGHEGEGIYRMELDGSGIILISDTSMVSGFSHVGNYLLYESSSENNQFPSLKRMDLNTGKIYTFLRNP